MNRKFRIAAFLVLVFLQIILQRYMNVLKFNLDLLYLILVYVSVRSNFTKTILTATAIGLVTDYFSLAIMGVFGFSRTLVAYFLNETSTHIDLKSNTFVFLFITVSLSLSNLMANCFFFFIRQIPFNMNLIVYQPILTGLVGMFILTSLRGRKYLDVY